MTIAGYKPSEIRKFIVAAIGAITILIVEVLDQFADFIPANVAGWITTGVAFATTVAVFLTKNAKVIDVLDGEQIEGVLVDTTAERITAKLDELISAVKHGGDINVTVEEGDGPGPLSRGGVRPTGV
ncbi:membrane protein [Gordonia phage Thimann]|uniref:Membrane protein n=1 Tax=Gordonia phage Suerte TaxID=2652883 RepID=A0A5P8DDB3_9CAUD|nr:membrane protein [Gordonia phage Suerte]QFP96993.1 membrane protein [Gordonia phage Suerte]WNM74285.1 membrane protein [Gordonia phage Thimann]